MTDSGTLTLTEALRQQTRETHEKLDHYLTSLGLFNNIELYKKFLSLQYYIHRDANSYYHDQTLTAIIPDLINRNRFEKVKEDLKDLKIDIPSTTFTSPNTTNASEAVGFLYVVEGSKLGANTLLKRVEKIGLSENYGARHMAPDQDGRGASWRIFQNSINQAKLDIHTTIKSATTAFSQILAYAKFVTT